MFISFFYGKTKLSDLIEKKECKSNEFDWLDCEQIIIYWQDYVYRFKM